jgi:S1-C subfamily serine protease
MSDKRYFKAGKYLWISLALILASLACRVSIPASPSSPLAPAQIPNPTLVLPTSPQLDVPQVVQDEQSLLIDLYQRVNPSVVNVTTYITQDGLIVPLAQGSGFVFDQAGNIVTNAHVIEGADKVEINFWDGSLREADIKGSDLFSDLAVLHVDNLPAGVLPLPLGDINEVKAGQTVIAIGNPFGWSGTLTRGVVSSIGRSIPTKTQFSIPEAIQTDAPINPGNSGGPLLNLKGEVIGVNAQINTTSQNGSNSGVGFAVPVSIVQRVAPALASTGNYEWTWLGVRGVPLNSIYAEAMNLPIEKGAYITDVLPDGPADKAGMHGATDEKTYKERIIPLGGDIITAIDGTPINSFDDLLIYVAVNTSPGQQVKLTVFRDGKSQEMDLTLEARPITSLTEATPIAP